VLAQGGLIPFDQFSKGVSVILNPHSPDEIGVWIRLRRVLPGLRLRCHSVEKGRMGGLESVAFRWRVLRILLPNIPPPVREAPAWRPRDSPSQYRAE
jgi:hypothetical protein